MMPVQVQHDDASIASSPVDATLSSREERLRILHVVSRLGMGGTEHGVLKVINGLGDGQFEHRICAVRGIDRDFARRMNAPHAYSAGSAKPGFQFPLFRLVRIMKEFRPHIVHTRNFGALEAIPAARMAGVPVAVHSEHGYELETLDGLPLRRRVLCRAFYAMTDAVFAVTRDLRTFHSKQSWLAEKNFRVIYNGVNLERFSPRAGAASDIRRTYDISEGRVVIGSIGRLVPIKDHATLLQAVELLLRKGANLHVLLVGDGPEAGRLKEAAAASPALARRVTFTGASDSVPELLSAMDIFVLPSICEGMSNTLLEAMACGLPVVATRTGGNPELVEDGKSGWLFSPRDAEGLANILGQLTEDLYIRRKLGTAARERALEQFSLAGMMQRYCDLYRELMARRASKKRG